MKLVSLPRPLLSPRRNSSVYRRTRRETIASSFFNPDTGRNSPRGTADPPRRNVSPCDLLHLLLLPPSTPSSPSSSSCFLHLSSSHCTFSALSPSDASSSSSPPSLFCPTFQPSLSQAVHSFLSLSLSALAHTTPPRAALKLAFSLLSSEAADFPHFTFQSRGGCDFLPHFHSDNIGGSSQPTSGVAKRERRGDGSSRVSPAVARQQRSGKRGWRKGSFANPSITC